MCGIIGIFGDNSAGDKIKKGLEKLKLRGRDATGIASEKKIFISKDLAVLPPLSSQNLMGHTLHSIVDYVPQPLMGEGLLVANCEIYNWQELSKKYQFPAKNDAELLLCFLDKFGVTDNSLKELDGVYAFAYWNRNKLYLARDILGVKPLWFSAEKRKFAFASERKVLKALGYKEVEELNPRHILCYNLNSKKITEELRSFFSYTPEHQETSTKINTKTSELLAKAILKRIPERKFGLLFSGGIDSTYLAHFFKQQGCDFTCYTCVLDSEKAIPSDLIFAEKAALELGLKLKVVKVAPKDLAKYVKKVIPLIEDSNPVKVSVAVTLFIAAEAAKKDGCKVIFSGLGSEEIFAGYERHKLSANINQECLSGLLKLYERDLYRDDTIAMYNGLELRLPFLDKELVTYALKIPEKYKINAEHSKLLFREIAHQQGISKELAFRKKVAAQYGSKIDSGLDKLARQKGFSSRPAYFKSIYPQPNLRLGVLFSSGKDSAYAALMMKRQNYDLSCLITIVSENQDSYMFHTPAIGLAKLQAKAMGIPIIMYKTRGEKEQELEDLRKALLQAKKKFKIEGIVGGALFSTYQRDRIEKIADSLGLKIFAPLWHKSQEQEMQELLDNGFKIILTGIAAEGLDKSWLNHILEQKDVDKLKSLKSKLGTNVAGEGGEFESLVLDCPLFNKKLVVVDAEILEESRNVARLIINKAKLAEK